MIDPEVRPAAPGDSEQLQWLEAEAREALTDQRGGGRWLTTHPARAEHWPGVIDSDVVHVAHIDGVVVGYLVLVVDDVVAIVDDVYVSPQARELGFGDALLDAGIESARERGCALLEGASLPGDRNTKNLYERAGIKARLITVSTEI
ncbi:GNAT family N-acetyltransferase [Ilumatobacter sp.]|uniref:GNAT family N-acetyltransferase n=1 Tax=Ilumatobacter sp. TaxID=1967498 RepID=UPI003AF7A77A